MANVHYENVQAAHILKTLDFLVESPGTRFVFNFQYHHTVFVHWEHSLNRKDCQTVAGNIILKHMYILKAPIMKNKLFCKDFLISFYIQLGYI